MNFPSRLLPCLVACLLSSSVLFAATPSATVSQFVLSPKPMLLDAEISNLSSIDWITTAGRYAWAVGDNKTKIAFYDGHVWSPAVSTEPVTSLLPLYPKTGEQPFALAITRIGLKFFDGAQWGQPTSMRSHVGIYDLVEDNDGDQLCAAKAAGGYAYVYCGHDSIWSDGRFVAYAIYNSRTGSWSGPGKIPGEMFETWGDLRTGLLDSVDVGDDEHPSLFITLHPGNWRSIYEWNLVEIAPNTIPQITPLPGLEHPEILVGQSKVFSKDTNSPGVWVKDLGKKSGLGFVFYKNPTFFGEPYFSIANQVDGRPYEANGVLCVDGHANFDDFATPGYVDFAFACLNTNSPKPTWTTPAWTWSKPKRQEKGRSITTVSGGWFEVNPNEDTGAADIFKYTLSSASLTDTHFPGKIAAGMAVDFRALDQGGVLACQYNKQSPQVQTELYYYEEQHTPPVWRILLKTPSSVKSNCAFSRNAANTKDGNNVWIYFASSDANAKSDVKKSF